ncbi:hypothetical protein M2459_003656 [Parabacteroides sp. PF5-5]|uniref:hypothetical protein n=1 Tax=unclassified Parabacteroides TaxID=2649774 RepID=UPI0024739835|nr:MULTISPECIES: hypothetical protein [unclassified Parabacteroides]MDH6305497.1 hypothetical protein [Parabacteroides sp. PH5-39]MDH6316247.1 hypothetical protein [Parabacteroides sp. PF5-13]MDH6320357.1 hypothetical protein [Parabacteroides sp. PH5-13]MDH6324087.1 hypothetical protein [Parabacteroides sp. PH5-8]MDH6329079.1 hypothetical protein [Parabacteroides sp. PH5-41]
MTQHNCEKCPIRAKYDKDPKSIIGRFWRWHINFCPGWKGYIRSLEESEKQVLKDKYQLKV